MENLKIYSEMKMYKCVGGRIQLIVIEDGISPVFIRCYDSLEGVTLMKNKIHCISGVKFY